MDAKLRELTEYGEVLTDANLAQFLATNNWTRQADRVYDEVWVQPGVQGERVTTVLLPRETRLVDYSRRLSEAIRDVARVYDWGVSQLAEQVAAIRADLFFVRVDQHTQDGTIPFRQASALLDNIDQLIRASAITAYNPMGSGKGRIPGLVQNFLEDDLRMGHTKKGSFIITVAARIDEPDVVRENVSSDERVPSFARQVMTTLARSLEVTRRHVARGDDFVDFEGAVEQGLRLPFVQALQEMGEGDALRALDLSFEWAASEPQAGDVPDHVVLDREILSELPEVKARLKRSLPPETVTVIGPVTELKRGDKPTDEGDDAAGEIVVRADLNGKFRRVTVPLSGQDYDWAIRAHQEHLPFTVIGELIRKGNSLRLEEPIEVDRSFLEFQMKAAKEREPS